MPKLGRRSERTELDYQMAPEIVRKDAPFGTSDTPTITVKIIGGRQVPVIEKHPTYNHEYLGSRIQALQPIAEKPNHLDPRLFGDSPGGYYRNDAQPSFLANRRPDSKDIVRGAYKALPPIQANRTRNDMSTVFEAESWTDNRNPPLADDTEYKQNFFSGKDFDNMDAPQPVGHKDHHFVSETETKSLSMLVPRNVLLPVDPIKLTREQETVLCKLIVNELNRFDPKELRDIYVECSQHDKELRGFCGVEILDNCLRRHKAFLSDTLRIIAAQFVDPNYPGKVNYEKVLSFIGSAIQLNERGQLSTEKQPKYYMQNGESYKTGSLYRDREVAKLLRMVEQELSKNTYTMDWTRWQNAFYERDRDRRETLSAAQIKDICYDQKLPLSDSLINHVLALCEDNNRDGQYRWPSFLEFLSRLRPSNTGLPMPVSKRPLDYAKHYPEPVPNWPRTDADTEHRGISSRRDMSPRRGESSVDNSGSSPLKLRPLTTEVDDNRDKDDRYSPTRREYNISPARRNVDRLTTAENGNNIQLPPIDEYSSPSRYGYLYDSKDSHRDEHNYRNEQRKSIYEQLNDEQRQSEDYDRRRLRAGDPRYTNRDTYQTENYYNGNNRGGGSFRGSDGPPNNGLSREEQIRQLSRQLKELETKYEITKEGVTSSKLPWLDRYLKMAQALYNSDISSKGSLPRKDAIDIVTQYNNAFDLNLDMARANMLAIAPDNLDKSGNIVLRSFLANLSSDRISY